MADYFDPSSFLISKKSLAKSQVYNALVNSIDASFALVTVDVDLKAPIASPTFTGTPTTPTPTTGDDSTQIATTEFVNAVAFSSALPGQTGNDSRNITTDGTTARWESKINAITFFLSQI